MAANPLRRAVATGRSVIAVLTAASGCALSAQSTEPPTRGATVHAAPPNVGPTATTDPRGLLTKVLATLQSACTTGQTTVTFDTTTFPPGSQVVLMTTGGGTVTYQFQTSAKGLVQTLTTTQYFQLVDWKYRFNRGAPVIVTDGANLVPIMAAVHEAFNNQQLSLDQAEQEINAGRPVGIGHLTAQLIFLQGYFSGRNPDGAPQLAPCNQVTLMFSSTTFTPEPANLG